MCIDPSNPKNLDIYQIVELFNELMEGCDEKIDTNVDLSTNSNKNKMLIDNFKEDKEIISKRKKLSLKFKTNFNFI